MKLTFRYIIHTHIHQIHYMIVNISCFPSELLGQAWMKEDVKNERAPHVLLVSKRFNEVLSPVN